MLRALSEDEIYTKSLGKNVAQAKVVSFVISGMLASIAGVLYAHYISYIDPTTFTIDESIFILSIVIIGGMRNLRGIFFASALLCLGFFKLSLIVCNKLFMYIVFLYCFFTF